MVKINYFAYDDDSFSDIFVPQEKIKPSRDNSYAKMDRERERNKNNWRGKHAQKNRRTNRQVEEY